jgi:hypothetical protein
VDHLRASQSHVRIAAAATATLARFTPADRRSQFVEGAFCALRRSASAWRWRHAPAHQGHLGPGVRVADHRRGIIREYAGHRREVAYIAIDDAEQRSDGPASVHASPRPSTRRCQRRAHTATIARSRGIRCGTSTARLLRHVLDANLSKYEPDPIGALERAESISLQSEERATAGYGRSGRSEDHSIFPATRRRPRENRLLSPLDAIFSASGR